MIDVCAAVWNCSNCMSNLMVEAAAVIAVVDDDAVEDHY
jgi:hypothetical protein